MKQQANGEIRIGFYICHCGHNIAAMVDCPDVARYVEKLPGVTLSRDYKYMCSDPGQELIQKDIREFKLNRVVVASCSPLLHEHTFRGATEAGGLNPFFFHMVNIREHDSWVHTDRKEATEKAKALARAAIERVAHHEALEVKRVPIHPDVLVVGGGIAGTPKAQAAYEEFYKTLGGKPLHHTLANHWARVIEMVYAAERMVQLVNDPEITSPDVRRVPTAVPRAGMGGVEAPRGTLFHHYETDERGLITMANMVVATGNNAARIAMSVEKAAKGLIKGGHVTEGLLNKVEMAFRAYAPCLGCATHSLPGHLPLRVNIYDRQRNLVRQLLQEW